MSSTGILTAISARQVADALRDAIFKSASFSCIATDALGVIQLFNAGAERMLGYTSAEVVNKITPADLHDPQETIARARDLSAEYGVPIAPGFETLAFRAARGIEDIYEVTKIRKDGSRLSAMLSVTALRGAQDAIIGYLMIATDNTARKVAEGERALFEHALQHKNSELESASRMKSEFVANMSHELRTPLNSIIGFSEVLRDGLTGEMTEQQRGIIGDINASGRDLLALINDILELSQVEAGRMTLDLEPVSMPALLLNGLSTLKKKASARGIRMEIAAPEELGVMQADGHKLKQIVHNMLSNAVKFTGEGGFVTLRARRVPRAQAGRLSSSGTGRTFPLTPSDYTAFLEISVADTGIGISDQDLKRLFRPFLQVDSGPARRFAGTGLGLALVKLLADLHQGTVAVESVMGEGSRFTVWLPIRDPALDGNDSVPLRPAEAPAGARTVLVVEDDHNSAALIRVQLEAEGFAVLHAASAEAALEMVVRQPVALITLDILLPRMDGWEFLSRIKQVPALQRIPVVIISIVADLDKGFSFGAAAVMQKPISRLELYESLVDLGLIPLVDGRPLTVLVVDDDPRAVELIAVRIMGLASKVLRAYGGQEAIDTARREVPNLILLDLMMPEVSGFDVVEALRERPQTAGIPILVVTAKDVTAEDRARLNGCVTAIVEKGNIHRGRFMAEVRRALSGRRVSA